MAGAGLLSVNSAARSGSAKPLAANSAIASDAAEVLTNLATDIWSPLLDCRSSLLVRRALLEHPVRRTGGRWHDQAGTGDLKRDAQRAGLDQIEVLAVFIAVGVQQRADVLAQGHDVEAGEHLLVPVVG